MDQSKNAYRSHYRQTLTPATRQELAQQALAALRRWPVYRQATLIATYAPLPWEMDMTLINRGMWADGKQLCFPHITGPGIMHFSLAETEDCLIPGAYGILTPKAHCAVIAPGELSLVIAPCEALDSYGTRLGKGGGYYDRFLSGYTGPTIAPLLPHQWAAQPLPREIHDRPIDYYILHQQIHATERKLPHAEQE